MTNQKKWAGGYQVIRKVTAKNDSLAVTFANDDVVDVGFASLQPKRKKLSNISWSDARVEGNGLFVLVPAKPEDLEISWDIIRRLTDSRFANQMIEFASNQARHIGGRIRTLRVRQGLTQSRVAELSGVEQANLSRIENGHYDVSSSTLWKLLAAMGCSVSELAESGQSAKDETSAASAENKVESSTRLAGRALVGSSYQLVNSGYVGAPFLERTQIRTKPHFAARTGSLKIVFVGGHSLLHSYLPALKKLRNELTNEHDIRITFATVGSDDDSKAEHESLESEMRRLGFEYLNHAKREDAKRYKKLTADILFSSCRGLAAVEITEDWLNRDPRPEQIFVEKLLSSSVDNVRRLLGNLRPWDNSVLAFDQFSARLLPNKIQMEMLLHFLGGGFRRFIFYCLDDSHSQLERVHKRSDRGLILERIAPVFAALSHFGAVETLRVTRIKIGRRASIESEREKRKRSAHETFAEIGLMFTDCAGNPVDATAYIGQGIRGAKALRSTYTGDTNVLEMEGVNGKRARFDLSESRAYCLDDKDTKQIEFGLDDNPYGALLRKVLDGSYIEDGIGVNIEVVKKQKEILEDIKYAISATEEIPYYPSSSAKGGGSPYLEEVLDRLPVLYGL